MAFIELKNITKIFGKSPDTTLELLKDGETKQSVLKKTGHTVGLNNVNLEIKKGEFFVIMGLSGSGKSTLIRCINKLIEPTSGEILIDGEDITKCNDKCLLELRRNKVSMVFQRFGLLPHKTVLQNVMFGLTIKGVEKEIREKEALETIEMVGLKGYEHAYPKQLSGGMQQRVGLARAITTNAEIILMDEAFSALDPLIRKQMQDEILNIQAKLHKTIIFITHDLDEALTLGDRIAIMKGGEVIQIGTSEDILMKPADDYVKDFVKDVNFAKIMTIGSIKKYQEPLILNGKNKSKLVKDVYISDEKYHYIVDENHTFLGLLNKEHVKSNSKFDEVFIDTSEIVQVQSKTKLAKLFNKISNTTNPIVILDNQQKYSGFVTRQTFLEALAHEVEVIDLD